MKLPRCPIPLRPILSRRQALTTVLAGGAIMAVTASMPATAADYPHRPIKLLVPFAPGGPNDVVARLIGPPLSALLGQPVVITNVGGAGGRIGSKLAASAAPDGYTLMMGGTNLNVTTPAVYRDLDYDPVGDFTPVGAVASDAMIMAVDPKLPIRNIQELVEYSKRNPGRVSAGSAPGIGPHFVIEMLKLRTGADISFVPYKGATPAIQDVLGSHLSMTVTNKAVLLPLIQRGMLRAIAVTSPERQSDLADTQTVREAGVQGMPALNWYGLMAPARTPAAVVQRLRTAVHTLMADSQVQQTIRKAGLEPAINAPDFESLLAAQRKEWGAITRETRIKLD